MMKKVIVFIKMMLRTNAFAAIKTAPRLLIVRHIESQMMVHLCPECMVENSDDYLLDNTRPWLGPKKIT